MSGRRRRDDGWDDSRLDAQDERRDPWADDGVDEWGAREADPGDDADRSRASSGGGARAGNGAAGAYVRNAPPGGKAYAAPAFPSFQTNGSSSGGSGYGSADDRYGAGSSHGGQRAASPDHAAAGYNGDGYRDAGYGSGRETYQGAGYGRNSSGGSNGGYGRPGYGSGGYGNDSGYGGGAGYAGANGRAGGPGHAPGFTPADNDDAEEDAPTGTPRPYGRLSIYTLHEDKTREFDRLAERAAEGVRAAEPDTLVYVIHVVPKAPMQRIIYEIYRDRAAFLTHERQPHIRQFAADRASCVLATNIIDLRLKYAKVAALGSAPEAPAQPQASWTPRAAEAAPGSDRYAAAPQYAPTQYAPTQQSSAQYSPSQYSSGQYSPAQQSAAQYSPSQYSSGQYSSGQPQGSGASASFTPAEDRYASDNNQHPTVGREAYSPTAQYGNAGNGAYGTGNGQYGAANSNGYSGAAGYTNGGSYSSNGYPSSNTSQGANGYSSDNGYSGANGYQSGNGYSGANGYQSANGYSGANGYSDSSGSSNGSGYPNGSGYAGGSRYEAADGYAGNGRGSYGTSASAQHTPRYRELTSGTQSEAEAGGYQDSGNRYSDGGRPSARPQSSDWVPRSDDYR